MIVYNFFVSIYEINMEGDNEINITAEEDMTIDEIGDDANEMHESNGIIPDILSDDFNE